MTKPALLETCWKEGIDGSQVFDFYKARKLDEIADYCKRDVETTRAVYKRMTFMS